MNTKKNSSITQTQEFWDEKYADFDVFTTVSASSSSTKAPNSTKEMFLKLLGNVAGKEILELGCGNGVFSVYMAKNGARVTAVDISKNSIQNTINLAKNNQVEHLIDAYQINALELEKLGKNFDLVVGKFILHHIEPFENFTFVLSALLKKGARGVFIENNSRNPILMLVRNHFIGKFGIPKYGDEEEHPFEPREIELLKQNVGVVNLYYPDFVFLRKINVYIFRKNPRFQLILNMFEKLDDFIKNSFPSFNQYSYKQIVEIYKGERLT